MRSMTPYHTHCNPTHSQLPFSLVCVASGWGELLHGWWCHLGWLRVELVSLLWDILETMDRDRHVENSKERLKLSRSSMFLCRNINYKKLSILYMSIPNYGIVEHFDRRFVLEFAAVPSLYWFVQLKFDFVCMHISRSNNNIMLWLTQHQLNFLSVSRHELEI